MTCDTRDRRKARIAYLSGPCDGPAVHTEWSDRRQPEYFGSNYMKQFLDLCTELDAEAYVVTTLPGEYSNCRRGRFVFENRPNPSALKGPLYHLAHILWFIRLSPKLLRFQPDVLIATENQNYWFMLFFLRWFRIPILPSFHSVLWPQYSPRKLSWRILWQLNRLLVLRHVKAMVVTSNDITRQLRALLGEADMEGIRIARHFPTYAPSQFASTPAATDAPRPPFRVFFGGRIETYKGVYDILEIARRLEAKRQGLFRFDICGEGGELDSLRRRIVDLNLQETVSCHGFCNAPKVSTILGMSHACIVPTRSEFPAGFEMTCSEAILANRPLITSAVAPALEDVRAAAVEVQPDNVDQYCQAILRLCDDPEYYSEKVRACSAVREPFYDLEKSWRAKIREALDWGGWPCPPPPVHGTVPRRRTG